MLGGTGQKNGNFSLPTFTTIHVNVEWVGWLEKVQKRNIVMVPFEEFISCHYDNTYHILLGQNSITITQKPQSIEFLWLVEHVMMSFLKYMGKFNKETRCLAILCKYIHISLAPCSLHTNLELSPTNLQYFFLYGKRDSLVRRTGRIK